MSSIYNIVAPTINPTATSSYSLKLHGNAETDLVSSVSGGNIQFNNNIQVNNVLGTASWASNLPPATYQITSSWANNIKLAASASHLNYSPLNGTASYAMKSETAAGATCVWIGTIGANGTVTKYSGNATLTTPVTISNIATYTVTHSLNTLNYFLTISINDDSTSRVSSVSWNAIDSTHFAYHTGWLGGMEAHAVFLQIWTY